MRVLKFLPSFFSLACTAAVFAVPAMTTIELSFVRLLREICEQMHMDVPPCVVSVDTDDKFVGYVDIHVSRDESIVEVIRCWSSSAPTAHAAEEEASRSAVKRLTQELDLCVKDVNYEEFLFYKNLNDQLTSNLASLSNQYNKLVWEYSFLKECYISTTAEKNEYAAERLKIQHAIQECHAVVNRDSSLPAGVMPAPLSDIIPPSLG